MRRIHTWLLIVVALTVGCGSSSRPTAPPMASEAAPVPTASASASAEIAPVAFVETVPTAAPEPAPVLVSPPDREAVIQWILGFLNRNAPPGRQTWYVEAQESKEDALVRYQGIAESLVDVVFDPENKPLFGGKHGRSRTITVLLGLGLYESGFMKNVDFGQGELGIGDSGTSYCLLQINVGKGRTLRWNTKEDRPARDTDDPADLFDGYTGPELVADRRKCFGEALKFLRLSFRACPGSDLESKIRTYGSGSCDGAVEESKVRMQTAIRFWDSTKKEQTWDDQVVVDWVTASKKIPPVAPLHQSTNSVGDTPVFAGTN